MLGTAAAAAAAVAVDVGDHHYLLPPSTVVEHQAGGAVSAEAPVPFFTSLYPPAAPATGWQLHGRARHVLFTRPEPAHPWTPPAAPGQPPAPGPWTSDVVRDGVHVWGDLSAGTTVSQLFLTYDGRTDFYVHCDASAVWNFERACEAVWNDAGLLAVFPIYGNRVAVAPAVVDMFRAAVRG